MYHGRISRIICAFVWLVAVIRSTVDAGTNLTDDPQSQSPSVTVWPGGELLSNVNVTDEESETNGSAVNSTLISPDGRPGFPVILGNWKLLRCFDDGRRWCCDLRSLLLLEDYAIADSLKFILQHDHSLKISSASNGDRQNNHMQDIRISIDYGSCILDNRTKLIFYLAGFLLGCAFAATICCCTSMRRDYQQTSPFTAITVVATGKSQQQQQPQQKC